MGLHVVGSIVQRAIGEGEANSAQKGSYVALLYCKSNIVCFLALRSYEKSAESKHEALYTQKRGIKILSTPNIENREVMWHTS